MQIFSAKHKLQVFLLLLYAFACLTVVRSIENSVLDSFNSQTNFNNVELPEYLLLLNERLWFRYRVLKSCSVIPMYILWVRFLGVTVASQAWLSHVLAFACHYIISITVFVIYLWRCCKLCDETLDPLNHFEIYLSLFCLKCLSFVLYAGLGYLLHICGSVDLTNLKLFEVLDKESKR